jgi:hypothetical protein
MEVIIIDSITHEWDGKGGILSDSDNMSGNSFTNWSKLTPRHTAFIDAILQCPCHIITTVRRKQDYITWKDTDGKTKVEKAGMKEITREGFEYELTVNLELDNKHFATSSKDRTGLFTDKPGFIPTIETGKLIGEWCESGVDIKTATAEAIAKLKNCASVEELKMFKETLQAFVINTPEFNKAAKTRFNEVNKPAPVTAETTKP